jgi:hypothetical protein
MSLSKRPKCDKETDSFLNEFSISLFNNVWDTFTYITSLLPFPLKSQNIIQGVRLGTERYLEANIVSSKHSSGYRKNRLVVMALCKYTSHSIAIRDQGDQIGRIFEWVIVNFGQVFLKSSPHIGLLFPRLR